MPMPPDATPQPLPDTSDIGMMYRQYLQSKGAQPTNTNMQALIAQTQREPGIMNGMMSKMIPNLTVEQDAQAPPNLAGASASSSGVTPQQTTLPVPPMPTAMPPPGQTPPPGQAPAPAQSGSDKALGGIGASDIAGLVLGALGGLRGGIPGARGGAPAGTPGGVPGAGGLPGVQGAEYAGRAPPGPIGQWGVDAGVPGLNGPSGGAALPPPAPALPGPRAPQPTGPSDPATESLGNILTDRRAPQAVGDGVRPGDPRTPTQGSSVASKIEGPSGPGGPGTDPRNAPLDLKSLRDMGTPYLELNPEPKLSGRPPPIEMAPPGTMDTMTIKPRIRVPAGRVPRL